MYRERARHDDWAVVDARARLEWGHSPDTVASELRQSGFPPRQVESIVGDFQTERAASLRRKYQRACVASIGLVALGLVAIALNALVRSQMGHSEAYLFSSLGFEFGSFAVAVGILGLIYSLASLSYVLRNGASTRE